ncbi:hypothetical protein HY970_02890 [Candidatus Kaiserbacteria bacterium]|nr:hypothetical protein [Candidatus Kaiserbacteria bacterium]
MVIERTLRRIENLKERPHHERRALAASIAIGLVATLFLGWSVLFFKRLAKYPAATSGSASQEAIAATASARAAFEASYASSSDGYVDLAPRE